MKKSYRIDIGNGDTQSSDYRLSQRTFGTLSDARATLRAHNGGRLHGKFVAVSYDGEPANEISVEGWNLGTQDGCDTAVIVRVS